MTIADLLGESLDGRLLFAVPKKGRLHEKCMELLNGADIQFRRAHRLDICLCLNLPIALVFLPASDIPSFVGKGSIDLGITGQDTILEARMQNHTTELLRLSFGKCALQLQVPIKSPFKKAEDLVGKRVVTSFEVLAGEWFKELDRKAGLSVEGEGSTAVEYVGGSVEAACALGLADGIVDLVESGDTMRAAGLHAIDTLLPSSEAVLISASSPKPLSVRTPEEQKKVDGLIELVKNRIAGVVASSKYVLCQYNVQRDRLADALKITPGRRAPTISPLESGGWVAVSSMVEKKTVAQSMDNLVAVGAEDVLILKLDNCRV